MEDTTDIGNSIGTGTTTDIAVDDSTATCDDRVRAPRTSFVLGGRVHLDPRTWRIADVLALFAVLFFAMIPVRGLYRAPGSSMEEGFMLVFPRLVQQGEIPNVDFLHLYGPGSLDFLAGWYWIFGATLEAERTFGLLQNLAIILALYALVRPWGRVAAVGAGCVASLLVMTPVGLAALAWHGAVAFALWAVVFALRARNIVSRTPTVSTGPTGPTSSDPSIGAPTASATSNPVWTWVTAGLLAGLALSFRPDIVIGVTIALLAAGWMHRSMATRPVLIGAAVGLIPMWIHLVIAGPVATFEGIVIDPVVRLRPGRELPSPPSFGELDGALQAIAEALPPWWGLPAPAARHQLFFWFFAVIVIAFAVPLVAWRLRRRDRSRQNDALFIAGLFGLGILPQAMQRPDSTHLAWVAMVSWPLLVATIAAVISAKRRGVTSPTRSPALVAVTAVMVLMLVVCPFYTFRYYVLHARVGVGDLPLPFLVERGDQRFWFGNPEVANALNEFIPELDARSEPGDRLIVGTADLSRTVYSDVSIYHLFPELEPATYFIEMDPGIADAEGSGLAEDIESADFLVLTNFWSGWLEPNTSTRRQSQEHNRAVADNFCLVDAYESNLLLFFERCEGGGGISGADIDGIYPTIPVPESLS